MASSSSGTKSQILSLLGDLTDSVDALPHELTRSFGDLRELDAVLRTSMQTFTSRIYTLIELMANPTVDPATRLRLLLEVAEDAQRLRMGSEDKIRVASRTADEVATHNQYNQQLVTLLADLDPTFEEVRHVRKTTYPHVAPSNLVPPTGDALFGINGRRKRITTSNNVYTSASIGIGNRSGGAAANTASAAAADKNKKRRLEEEEGGPRRTPKGKERTAMEKERDVGAGADRDRPKVKKPRQRSPSPDGQEYRPTQTSSRQTGRQYDFAGHAQFVAQQERMATNGYPHSNDPHRSRHNPPPPHEQAAPHYSQSNSHGQHNSNGYTYNGPPPPGAHNMDPSKRPTKPTGTSSLLDVVANRQAVPGNGEYAHSGQAGSGTFDDDDYEVMERHRARSSRPREESARAKEAAYARNGARDSNTTVVPGPGEGGDGDERLYCYCNRVSFGEMVGCDDDQCGREWFHLGCLGLSAPPKNEHWYCDDCKARREKERNARNRNRNRARPPVNGATANNNGNSNGSRASVPPASRSGTK